MKVVNLEKTSLEECIRSANQERVILTQKGKPVAIVIGVNGLDLEQIELGHSDEFWSLIRERRAQKTMSRADLEKKLAKEK
jgi:antitoxin (DNA-binding transcriptional repressor) of toxin-antitoxin stability system